MSARVTSGDVTRSPSETTLRMPADQNRQKNVSEMASASPTCRFPSPLPPNALPTRHHARRSEDGLYDPSSSAWFHASTAFRRRSKLAMSLSARNDAWKSSCSFQRSVGTSVRCAVEREGQLRERPNTETGRTW